MTTTCNDESKIIAQTLFLGASVSSFNTSMGWGGQPTQLTVNLVDDTSCYLTSQWSGFSSNHTPNHYHTCTNDCYFDKSTKTIATANSLRSDLITQGKVYYLIENDGLISYYHTLGDPGFFGEATSIDVTGKMISGPRNYKYDIIDVPVFFKMGNFSFGGFVQSWNRSLSSSGKNYTVIINGPQSILNSCYIILDKFAGSMFRSLDNNKFGFPTNYIGTAGISNSTSIKQGVFHNVFNVYGYLESLGIDGFGGSNKNDQGISANLILKALYILTSNISNDSSINPLLLLPDNKHIFSNFARVISRTMSVDHISGPVDKYGDFIKSTFNSCGIIPPSDFDPASAPRPTFVLDLSEVLYADNSTVYKMPDSIRLSGSVISVTELLNQLAEKCGFDYYTELVRRSGLNIIKVRTISRLKQPYPNNIENTIKALECKRHNVSSATVGKEKNETASRAMIVGGQQQRLLQVRSYRLSYHQTTLAYEPIKKQFVDYNEYSNHAVGQIRYPHFADTRNETFLNYGAGEQKEGVPPSVAISKPIADILRDSGPKLSTIIRENRSQTTIDPVWNNVPGADGNTRSSVGITYGNYLPASSVPPPIHNNKRFIPIYLDYICPFMGFVYNEDIKVKSSTSDNASQRNIRPVWLDSWTGQLCVRVQVDELPNLNVSLTRVSLKSSNTGTDPNPFFLPYADSVTGNYYTRTGFLEDRTVSTEWFIVTESEIRAALAGFDNFLVYCLAKTYKPDLIEMVRRAYYIKTKDQLINAGVAEGVAEKIAANETDWYWKLTGGNIAGDDLYPTSMYPDKTDGSQYIQEKALQDLKIIHSFISQIGQYYGKTYMVKAPFVRSYSDTDISPIRINAGIGIGYVFSGSGKLYYNYEPTNDGAWEEYGNIIDDTIVVGGVDWYALTDDVGKIKPILGYNNNYYFDYIRFAKCKVANNIRSTTNEFNIENGANPYFSYNAWLSLFEHKTSNCGGGGFVFPSLDLSSMSTESYVLINQFANEVKASVDTENLNINLTNAFPSYDAFGKPITDSTDKPLPASKIYLPASVDETMVYLDAINLLEPRILIDGPGIVLNVSSEDRTQDPNKIVLTNIAAEDLSIYINVNNNIVDPEWVNMMLGYISPPVFSNENNPEVLGVYTISSNHTSNNVELAPKAAHPFFAAIPIRSHQFVYGPWTNYPKLDTNLYQPKIEVTQDAQTPPSCTRTNILVPSSAHIDKLIDNLITNTEIEINEDFVPWNYGGAYYMDIAALKEINTKINYQAVIETAQLDIAGLPLWNLGGKFNADNIDANYIYEIVPIELAQFSEIVTSPSYIAGTVVSVINAGRSTVNKRDLLYRVPRLSTTNIADGPIITNIQCSAGQGGVSSTYSFRTYTRKMGLFNKEDNERLKKINKFIFDRNKSISNISQQVKNLEIKQREALVQNRLEKSQFNNSSLSSKLFGWSPGMILIGRANPLINEPDRIPAYVENYTLSSAPDFLGPSNQRSPTYRLKPSSSSSLDPEGMPKGVSFRISEPKNTNKALKYSGRIATTVSLFERKEVENQIKQDYGSQSMMSLDGLLSPVSFYPTYKFATFPYSLHNTYNCPFCRGTKKRTIKLSQYTSQGRGSTNIFIVCDKCTYANNRLNSKLNYDDEIPINLITLNPIVVPYGEFKNFNSQQNDRLRHSIEIVGRGSIPQNRIKYSLEISRNYKAQEKHPDGVPRTHLDYAEFDYALNHIRSKVGDQKNILSANNQRFFGLRGPLTMHAWGYDEEGYPIPNAADEPYEMDDFGRPKRFKLKLTSRGSKKYKSLAPNEVFTVGSDNSKYYAKTFNMQNLPTSWSRLSAAQINETSVSVFVLEDDLKNAGGFVPGDSSAPNDGFKGSIISKTQKWNGSRWSEKTKLNSFYLNWAERPDLWKVGPIDLFWDSDRGVWTGGAGGEEIDPPYIVTNANDISALDAFFAKKPKPNAIYRFIYATLEEDLIKQPDFDETFATRAYIDDIEYSKEPLLQGYRRLIYIKDKCGYSAPRGTKLLCRYNKMTGFYEPITKPVSMATGRISSSTTATITPYYAAGRRANRIPSTVITFNNPLGFSTSSGALGIFTFINGQWTLTSAK